MARTITQPLLEHRFDWVRTPYGEGEFDKNEWEFYLTTIINGVEVGSEVIGFITWHGTRYARTDIPSPPIGDLFGGCIYDLNEPGTDESNWCEAYTVKEAMRWCERQVGASRSEVTIQR